MHIRALVLGCVAALGMMAMSPVAMAMTIDDPPEICVLDFSQPSIDQVDMAAPTCEATERSVAGLTFGSTSGDEGGPAQPSCAPPVTSLDLALYRIHVDPGRCLA